MGRTDNSGLQGPWWCRHVVSVATLALKQSGILDSSLTTSDMTDGGFGNTFLHIHGELLFLCTNIQS